MNDDPELWTRRQFDVEARPVTEANILDVANWCGGTVCSGIRHGVETRYISSDRIFGGNSRQAKAYIGDWVVFSDVGKWKFYTDSAFRKTFYKKPAGYFDEAKSAEILEMVHKFKVLLTK